MTTFRKEDRRKRCFEGGLLHNSYELNHKNLEQHKITVFFNIFKLDFSYK